MNHAHEEGPCPGLPGLELQYGNLARKWWPLNHDAVVVGRALRCDLVLDAPEVSQVHCVLARCPEGWRVRDFATRSGTRVNGEPIVEAALADEDILKVGSFTFTARLPALKVPGTRTDSRLREKLQRSRHRLARWALLWRQRLREHPRPDEPPLTDEELLRRELDLNRQADLLRDRLRESEQRAVRLEQAERDLTLDRRALDDEFTALQQRIERTERELQQRQEEVEADLRRRWEESEQRSTDQPERRLHC